MKPQIRLPERRYINDLTVCITNFGRAKYLERALASCVSAGIVRIAVASVCPTPQVRAVLKKFKADPRWLSFDVSEVSQDIGCNSTWELAAWLSRTKKVLVLHDDDALRPAFGQCYENVIGPHLGSGVGLVTWRAHILYDDGRIEPTEYWWGPTRLGKSFELETVVAKRGRLSLSPVVSVMDRETVVRSCREAEITLRHNQCLEHPGMLLGTEILTYLRHLRANQLWLYVDAVLSLYGSHGGSGTIQAQNQQNGIARLALGYDRARDQADRTPPPLKPRIILVTYERKAASSEEARRIELAERSRRFLEGTFEVVRLRVRDSDLKRILPRKNHGNLPYVRDLFDLGCSKALPCDAVVYSNDDIGLTLDAPSRILIGIERGRGVTVCPRRQHTRPDALMRSVLNCKLDGGCDVVAVSPAWWASHRDKMPDMVIGTDAWDTVFRQLAEEWADGKNPSSTVVTDPHFWFNSRAYSDDVCWHVPHHSRWIKERDRGREDVAGDLNRALARSFFADRYNDSGMQLMQNPSRCKVG